MSKEPQGIATLEDIEYGINNDLLMYKLLPQAFSKRCVTKDNVLQMLYVDESKLSGLTNNRLVRWDLIETTFVTDLFARDYQSGASQETFKIGSQHGYDLTGQTAWLTLTPLSKIGSGITTVTMTFIHNSSSASRTTDVVITEKVTGNKITVAVRQLGVATTVYMYPLNHSSSSETICQTQNLTPFYLENGETFDVATKLWSNDLGTVAAPSGFYYDNFNNVYRQWTGTFFTGSNGTCEVTF